MQDPDTTVLRISPDEPDQTLVDMAAAVLRDGGLVAIPTETVYGLGCNALDPDAVGRVFEAKGRPASDPLIVHVDGPDMAAMVVDGPLPPAAAALADAFWPGPLTLVLPRAAVVPDAVTSGLDTVGVRSPAHPVAAAIIRAAGVPVAAPSANRFGRISPTSADHVVAELDGRCDLIIDAGRTDHGVESTVVAFDGDRAVVLRHGAVTLEQLAEIVPVRTLDDTSDDAAKASPGHDQRHYSPRAPTVAAPAGVHPNPAGSWPSGVVHLGYEDRPPALPTGWSFVSLGRVSDLGAVAHDLYDSLRRLDQTSPTAIVVELTGADGLGRAIDDRLTRAAGSLVAHSPAQLADALHRLT